MSTVKIESNKPLNNTQIFSCQHNLPDMLLGEWDESVRESDPLFYYGDVFFGLDPYDGNSKTNINLNVYNLKTIKLSEVEYEDIENSGSFKIRNAKTGFSVKFSSDESTQIQKSAYTFGGEKLRAFLDEQKK